MRGPERGRRTVRLWLTALVAGTVLAACSVAPADTRRPAIIPDTTKVADAATRDALASYDPASGELRFASGTQVLDGLRVGDVLVSQPSAHAPAGYLRKVESIGREGGEVVLVTSQANLTDAITQGEIVASGDLEPEDVTATAAHLPGVTAGVRGDASTRPGVGTGDGYSFHVGFDEVALDIGQGDVQVEVVLDGDLYFNAGWSIDLGIEPCLAVPPVCVDRFEAKVGVEERLRVSLSGEAKAQLTKEVSVATYHFRPLVFFIGPVPVVVVPSIEVFVGAEGAVSLRFSYGLTETASAVVGARWTDDGGWQDITGFGVDLAEQDSFDVSATMDAQAYARAVASLKFYDAAGPALGLRLGVEFDAEVPRDPILVVRGKIAGYVAFVVDLPVLGTLDEHRKTLFDETYQLTTSPNQPPRFSGVKTDTIHADVGSPVVLGPRNGGLQGYFDVMDPEGGTLRLAAVSSLDGPIPLTYTFTTPGTRTVTVTATDPHGAAASATLTVEAASPPPIITTSYSGQPLVDVPYAISANAYDPVGGDLFCSALTWSVAPPDTLTGGGCQARVTFMVEGQRTVEVTATNPYGSSSTETLTFDVGPEPENKPPLITSFHIVAAEGPRSYPTGPGDIYACITGYLCEVPEGAVLWNGQARYVEDYVLPLYLSVAATDDRGAPLTVTWSCTAGTSSATVTDDGDGTFSCSPYFPGQTIVVKVVVSDGDSASSMQRSFFMRPRVN